jgi:hypothetical protein
MADKLLYLFDKYRSILLVRFKHRQLKVGTLRFNCPQMIVTTLKRMQVRAMDM